MTEEDKKEIRDLYFKEKLNQTEKDFSKEALKLLVVKYKYGVLRQEFVFRTAAKLIDLPELTEADKKELRFAFALDMVYVGSDGYKKEEQETVNRTINVIITLLEKWNVKE